MTMYPIWPATNSNSLKSMNELHREVLETLAGLSQVGEQDFEQAYAEFLRKAEHAFACEAIWLENAGHPVIKDCIEQQGRILGGLHHVHARIMQGDSTEGRHIVEDLLPQWFAFHINTMDMALRKSMQRTDFMTGIATCRPEYIN